MSNEESQGEIDFDHLNQYVSGDISLTKEIFSLFKNQVDMWSRSFKADIPDEIWSAMTHSLKGTARAVGAMRLAELCETAEGLTGEGNRPGAREVTIEQMETRISNIMIEIQRWEYRQTIKDLKSDSPWPAE